jgi:hypothetical protein
MRVSTAALGIVSVCLARREGQSTLLFGFGAIVEGSASGSNGAESFAGSYGSTPARSASFSSSVATGGSAFPFAAFADDLGPTPHVQKADPSRTLQLGAWSATFTLELGVVM